MNDSEKEEIVDALKTALLLLIAIILATAAGIWIYKTFGPEYQKVERSIFEQSPQFINGINQDVGRRCLEYSTETNPKVKHGIGQYILDQVAQVENENNLNVTVRECLKTIRGDFK